MTNDFEIFQRAMTFAKNKRPNGGLSNIYVAQTIDRDGNVTSETYGMNMMTDYGFERYFDNGTSWPRNVYIGGAQNAPSLINTSAIFETITNDTDNSTIRETEIDYKYPMYYYAQGNDGIVTCVCKFQKSTFDWNLSDVTDDISIGEYGIGEAINQLWTHSWVYDITGRKTIVTKHPNERLEMTIYFCLTYKLNLIKNNWANDIYIVITDLYRFLNNNGRMNDDKAGILRRNTNPEFTKATSQSSFNNLDNNAHAYMNTQSTITNRQQDKFTAFHPFDIYATAGNYQGYFNGFYTQSHGFQILSPEEQSSIEAFDITFRTTYQTGFHNTCLADRFGDETNDFPMTQANITHCYVYNRISGDYDNPVGFTNDVTHQYSEASFDVSVGTPIYYTNRDNILTMYVYQNLNTSDPIDIFNNVNIDSIYATDSYWDFSSWKIIQNPFDIPAALKTKRYYITNSNVNKLIPVRQSGEFKLNPSGTYVNSLQFVEYGTDHQRSCCDNATVGYFVRGDYVYFPNTLRYFQIGSNLDIPLVYTSGSMDHRHYAYGNIVLTFSKTLNDGRYYITNMDNISEPYSLYKSIADVDGYTSFSENILNNSYITESSTGIMCLQRTSTVNECVVFDLSTRVPGSQNQFAQYHYDSIIACAIYSTDNKRRVAYVPTSDTSIINVVDYSTGSVIKTFNIPAGANAPIIMWGLNNYLWVTDGATWSRVYDIDGSVDGTACTNNMTLITNKADLKYINITAVNDVILIYKESNMEYSSQIFYTRTDTTVNTIYNLGDYAYQSGDDYKSFTYIKLRYIENNKTLVLAIGNRYLNNMTSISNHGTWISIIDFGKYLNPPASAHGSPLVDQFTDPTIGTNRGICFYGENIIRGYNGGIKMIQTPISNMLTHRIVGTTTTHSAVNDIIHVAGKNITTTYSNTVSSDYPESGYPPGSQN